MERENLKSYLTGISHSVCKEKAGYSHTPGCYLSKLRSSLEAGKKQLRVWLQYVNSMTEVFLYPSFGVFWPPFVGREMVRNSIEDGLIMPVLLNICMRTYNEDFVFSLTHVQRPMQSYSYLWCKIDNQIKFPNRRNNALCLSASHSEGKNMTLSYSNSCIDCHLGAIKNRCNYLNS